MKKKNTSKKNKKPNDFEQKFIITNEQHLEKLIQLSERSANSESDTLCELFNNQANRLRKELEKLRKR